MKVFDCTLTENFKSVAQENCVSFLRYSVGNALPPAQDSIDWKKAFDRQLVGKMEQIEFQDEWLWIWVYFKTIITFRQIWSL